MRLVIGGYGPSLGVVDLEGGGLGTAAAVADAAGASWVLPSRDGRFVYAALEAAEGHVGAWAVTPDGPWRPLGRQPTGGADPCHLALSPDGRWLLAANYTSGSVSVHPVLDDGSLSKRTDLVAHSGDLGPVADRQDQAHAHQVVFAPDGTLLVCDLGLDVVVAYAFYTGAGRLTEVARSAFPPGTGPRHLVVTADGSTAYVVGELSSTVSVCRVDGPRLEVLTTVSARGGDAVGESTAAEIVLAEDEQTVVVSNRGDDTVATLAVDASTARLVSVDACGGAWPRWAGLAGSSDGLVVANERSGAVATLRRAGDGWVSAGSVPWDRPACLAALAPA
jgi:6-phosphogluconolactonase